MHILMKRRFYTLYKQEFSKFETLDYPIVNTNINFGIDAENIKDLESYIHDWAYYENDICRVILESGGNHWETCVVDRPDVQEAFGLNSRLQGFEAIVHEKLDGYTLYLINDEKKEIYRKEIKTATTEN